MIRFSYSQIEATLSCADCDNRNYCAKERYRKLPTQTAHICDSFVKRRYKPEVKTACVDYNQLMHQLSNWNCIAEGVKNHHMSIDWYGGLKDDKIPGFTECLIFIEINKIFMEYLTEFKEMLLHSNSILELLLQTVYSVDMNNSKVSIYTKDKLLLERIENYLHMTDFKLREDTYENIMGISKDKNRIMQYIVL